MSRMCHIMTLIAACSLALNGQISETKLLASDGQAYDEFGYSVSILGDYAMVGAHKDYVQGSWVGSVYVFIRDNDTWVEHDNLTASDGQHNDLFGSAVFLSNNYALIGAEGAQHQNRRPGAVYVFRLDGEVWVEEAKLTPSDPDAVLFGRAVSASTDRMVVGAANSAYVFREDSTWIQEAELVPFDGTVGNGFGASVSIYDEYAFVSNNIDDEHGVHSGAVYVFHREGETWNAKGKLVASDASQNDHFGTTVSASGEYLLIGAPDDDDGYHDSGSMYIFRREGESWVEVEKLLEPVGREFGHFGVSAFLTGDSAIIGAYLDDGHGGNVVGSAYIIIRQEEKWVYKARIAASDGPKSNYFGYSVSLSGDNALIGAYFDDDNGMWAGAAYLYSGLFPDVSVNIEIDSVYEHVPAEGDTFPFELKTSNNTINSVDIDVWVNMFDPDGGPFGNTIGPTSIELQPLESVTVEETLFVAATASSGDYDAIAYVGFFPGDTLDSDVTGFTKLFHPPYVVNPIPVQTLLEDFKTYTVADLDTIFDDPDTDTLSYLVQTDGNVIASIETNSLILSPVANFYGSSEVIVTAMDQQPLAADDTFYVYIQAINDSPSPFSLLTPEDTDTLASDTMLISFTWQTPEEPDGDVLTYNLWIANETTDTLFQFELSETYFDLEPHDSLEILAPYFWSVSANDSEFTVASEDTFTFYIPDVTPMRVNPIRDQYVGENFETYIVANLDTVFFDYDSDTLTYSAETDGNTAATVVGLGNILALSSVPGVSDTSQVIVTAADEQQFFVYDTFLVFIEPVTGVHTATGGLPASHYLHRNHPNPFNPSTVIRYELPIPGEVRLTVYDLLGREVRELIDGSIGAGYHHVIWDGTNEAGENVASGIYLYRMTAGGFVQTRKMLLTR